MLKHGHVYAVVVVAATVGFVGKYRKELIGCNLHVSGCCGAVRHRIAPAIDDVLRPSRVARRPICRIGELSVVFFIWYRAHQS